MKRELVGHIGVDAGLCWIGDPCYILHTEDGVPRSLGRSWEEFCDTLEGMKTHKQFNYDLGHEGLGVVVSTGDGDGCYPVYATINKDGRVASVTVEFIGDEEEE